MPNPMKPDVAHLRRIGFPFKPENFVVESRPLTGLAVGSRLPGDVTSERVAMLYDQNYVGFSEEAKVEFDRINTAWSRRMNAVRESKNTGQDPKKPIASAGRQQKHKAK